MRLLSVWLAGTSVFFFSSAAIVSAVEPSFDIHFGTNDIAATPTQPPTRAGTSSTKTQAPTGPLSHDGKHKRGRRLVERHNHHLEGRDVSANAAPSTGVWLSSDGTRTVTITTASVGSACGAAFGTRTICATPSAVCTPAGRGSTCQSVTATPTSISTVSEQTGTGLWMSSDLSRTIYITTASMSNRCGAASNTRTVCESPTAVCTQVSGQAFSTCLPVPTTTSSATPEQTGTGVWLSSDASRTIFISTASLSGRCGAAFNTRTVCSAPAVCTSTTGQPYSSCGADAPQTTPTTAPISVQTGTGVWQSSAASTTIVITTASTGERCGAAFGTRTVCATPSAVCTSTSGQAFQTCSAVPKQPVLIGPPYPKSTVQCLDGSTYRGPMNQCNLPFPPSLGYASGFNYSQYLYVGRQPKFHIEAIAQLADQMVDPIISPGQPFSQHTHTFFGGSMINPNLTYEQLQNGSCSSVSVQADKSSYWIPSLYAFNGTTYQRLQPSQRFYYIMSHWVIDGPPEIKPFEEVIHPFPKGFRQLIGDPARKTYDPNNQAHARSGSFFCWRTNGTVTYHTAFPTGCTALQVISVTPPCWDGVNLYLQDSAHMAYSVNFQNEPQGEGGWCPPSHPVRLPQVMFESTFDTTSVVGNFSFVFANGDTTGYAAHADFFNGWDIDVLQAAIDTVYVKGATPAQSKYYDLSSADMMAFNNPSSDIGYLYWYAMQCKIEQPLVAGGFDIPYARRTYYTKLPGCNPLWSSGPKPTC